LTDPRGYEVKVETVHGCGADWQIRSLLDRQQYFDPLGEALAAGISSAAWPLFGHLWPSARVLAHEMLAWELSGQRILEVGCGLALASLVLHRRECEVVATDCHPLVPEFLARNLTLNALTPLPYRPANWALTDGALGRFDLIIGSDVLYEPGHAGLLSRFIDLHAEADGQVLLVDPNRAHRARFTHDMEGFGFGLTSVAVTAAPGLDERYRGRLLTWTRA
jgi:predicted nicotinamide N-methyase